MPKGIGFLPFPLNFHLQKNLIHHKMKRLFMSALVLISTTLFINVASLWTEDKVDSVPDKPDYCALKELITQWLKNVNSNSSVSDWIKLVFPSNATELKLNSTLEMKNECGVIMCVKRENDLVIRTEVCNICTSEESPEDLTKHYPYCCPKCVKDDLKMFNSE